MATKIVFICGSLEPGHDGVGDYARRLAIALGRQRPWETAALALNDPYVKHEVTAVQSTAEGSLPTLRLPAAWPVSQRFARAKQWLDEFGADWLSLQFVPFAFHPKGLPVRLSKQLDGLGEGRKWHFMMHELWVGMDTAASTKYVAWGAVQKFLIKNLIARLQPRVVHTQTQLYQAQLDKLGVANQYLALFSNIPNTVPSVANADSRGLPEKSLVVFGTIHGNAPVKQLAHDAAQYAHHHSTPVRLVLLGRCGREQAHWVESWEAAGLPVEVLGEQPPSRISEVLAAASLGIATTPASLLGKSGAVAAMREHGLPVLCVSGPWQPRGLTHLPLPEGVAVYKEGSFETYLVEKSTSKVDNTVEAIANRLSESLLANS